MNYSAKIRSITKILSPNDIGLTGGHQSGILIPKQEDILSFFPKLNRAEKNPRYTLVFHDDNNVRWEFSFIYYNNAFFGGTRNEYRLTRMTKYINSNNLKVGDELFLINSEDNIKRISFKRSSDKNVCIEKDSELTGTKLRLSAGWKVIPI